MPSPSNRGITCCHQQDWCRRYEEAERLLEAALPAAEAISGDGHPRVALVLQTLGGIFARTRRISFAEGLYKCGRLVWRQLQSLPPYMITCM